MVKTLKIKEFAEVITGGTPSTSNPEFWNEGDIPWLNSGELNQGVVRTTKNYISRKGLESCSARLMPVDSVLIALTGTTTGVTAYLEIEACANQSVTGILPSNIHNSKYLFYYLSSIRKKILDDSYGGAQKHISQGYVRELEVPLPPLKLQNEIADILDKADALFKTDQKLLQKYDELAQAIFIDMFGDPVSNEKGWKLTLLGDLGDVSSGSTPSRKNANFFKGRIPWVKTTEVKGNQINTTEEHISEEAQRETSCRLNPVGSILIAMYGQGKTRGNVGLLCVEAATNQACGVLKPSSSYASIFMFYQLKFLYSELRSLGRGGNQENLNLSILKNFPVILPSIDLQNAFVKRIKLLEEMQMNLKTSFSEKCFDSCINRVFSQIL